MKKGCVRTLLFGLGLMFALAAVWLLINFAGAPGKGEAIIPISPETTIVDGPLNEHGDVDFRQYLNEKYGDGVTAENNAAVAIVRILGPDCIEEHLRGKTFALLGIEPLPDEGDYFVDYDRYIYDRKKQGEIDQAESDRLHLHANFAGEPWTSEDHPELAAWFDENHRFIEEIHLAAEKPRYWFPLIEDSNPVSLAQLPWPMSDEIRAFARTLHRSAMRHLAEKDIEASLIETMTIRRLSRLVAQKPLLVDQLIAIAINGVAMHAQARIVLSESATREEIKAYRNQIAKLPALESSRDRIDTTERMACLNLLTVLARDSSVSDSDFQSISLWGQSRLKQIRILGRHSTDWGEAALVANEWYDKLVAASDLDDFSERAATINALEDACKQDEKSIDRLTSVSAIAGGRRAKGRLTGRLVVPFSFPASSAVTEAETRSLAYERMLQIAFSLGMCQVDHDSYPDSLEELKPDYMNEIPIDPFSLKQFIYGTNDDSYLLYSVGQNMADDGGYSFLEGPNGGGDDYRLLSGDFETWEEYKQRESDEKAESGNNE